MIADHLARRMWIFDGEDRRASRFGYVTTVSGTSWRYAARSSAACGRGTPHTLVWWQGMSRFVRCDEVERVVGGEA